MMRGLGPVRTRDASSRKVTSRTFSRGGARLAELDLRVSAGHQLVLMKLPDATGVVQLPCGVSRQCVAADWLGLWLPKTRTDGSSGCCRLAVRHPGGR
jgi:hypothetical protein